MRYGSHCLLSFAMGVAASTLLVSAPTQAGQFKTLNTATLAAGAVISAQSTPRRPISGGGALGGAVEMETYEFQTSVAGGTYSCEILANKTNQTLNESLIGVNATVINSCSAPAGGSCSTPPIGLIGNLKFQCLVATSCCNATAVSGYYIVGVHH